MAHILKYITLNIHLNLICLILLVLCYILVCYEFLLSIYPYSLRLLASPQLGDSAIIPRQ